MCAAIHVCMHVIIKLGFERYGRGNCPGGNCPGVNCLGELSGGEMSVPPFVLSSGLISLNICVETHQQILSGLLNFSAVNLLQ